MKYQSILGVFLCLYVGVVCAQNNTAAPASAQSTTTKSPTVTNFPTRAEAKTSWKEEEQRLAAVERGNAEAPKAAGGRVVAEPLPHPKINYAREAIERTAPMSPEELRSFADEMYKRAIEASRVPGGPYTMKGDQVVTLDLSPSADPKQRQINIAMNMGATISFVDRAGAEILIDAARGFSPAFAINAMESEEVKKVGTNSLYIEASTLTGQGNLAIRLEGMSRPIMFNVNVGKSNVVDGNIQYVVPMTSASKRTVLPGDRMESDAVLIAPEMQGFLAGIAPEGATAVKVERAGDTTAWMWNNRLFLRTRSTVLTPGWFRRQASSDGMAVYELPMTPVVSLGVEGRELRAVLDFPFIPPAHSHSTQTQSKK